MPAGPSYRPRPWAATCLLTDSGTSCSRSRKAHDVDVVLGQQPEARLQDGKDGVAREHVGAPTFDVDLFELVAQSIEESARIVGPERRRREPLAEVTRPRRAVRAHVAPADLEQRTSLLDLLPAVDPLIRAHEGDLGALRRPLAELVEEERKAREQTLPYVVADSLHDLLGELVPPETAAVERIQNCCAGRLRIVGSQRGMQNALRVAPGFQPLGLIRRRTDGAPGGVPERQFVRRMKVERSTQRPRLDERPLRPERLPDIRLRDAVEACAELKLRGRLNLRVHPAEPANDVDETLARDTVGE